MEVEVKTIKLENVVEPKPEDHVFAGLPWARVKECVNCKEKYMIISRDGEYLVI